MVVKRFIRKNKKKRMVIKGHKGTSKRPRLSVYRSNRYIYAQLIDDLKGVTLITVSEKELEITKKEKTKPVERAKQVGELLAKKAIKKKIKKAIFDRRNYKYHGRVKNLADGARSEGMTI